MSTPILNLFREAALTKNDIHKREEYKKRAGAAHEDLKAAGWKKVDTEARPWHVSYTHIYEHPHHTGHVIRLNSRTGEYNHSVHFHNQHKQEGKAAAGMSELAKHLDAHSRHAKYDAQDRAAERKKQSWGSDRPGTGGFAGPRGFGG